MPMHSPALPMLHLMRLVSPSQPVGAFSYSRGLEWAVHAGTVTNEESCAGWVFGLLEHSYAVLDGAIFWRMISALMRNDDAEFCRLNDWLGASRESSELELEDRRMGESCALYCRNLVSNGPVVSLRNSEPPIPQHSPLQHVTGISSLSMHCAVSCGAWLKARSWLQSVSSHLAIRRARGYLSRSSQD